LTCFNDNLPGKPALASPSVFFHLLQERTFRANCFTRCPTSYLAHNQPCQSTEETQSTDLNQWPGLILSSPTTGLL